MKGTLDNAVIQMKIKEHDEILKEHAKEIEATKEDRATFREQIKHLCSKVEEQTGWIKALVLTVLGTLGGFLIWYIQSLPRG